MRSIGRAESDSSPTSSKCCSWPARIPASSRTSVPAFPQSIGLSAARTPRRPTPRTRSGVDVGLVHRDAERPHGRDRRLRVGRAAEARDARLALADRAEQDGAVRDRLVPGHGDMPDQRGCRLDAHPELTTSDVGRRTRTSRVQGQSRNADLLGIRLRVQRPRQLQRRVPPVPADAGAGRGVLLHRRSPLDHDGVRPGGAARARRSTCRRCSSPPASTRSARSSSPRATSRAHAEATWLLSRRHELR